MKSIGLFLTNVCNRRCAFCFRREGWPHEQWMSEQDFDVFVEWVERAGVGLVTVAGGEPTLHPQFAEAVSTLRRRAGMQLRVITNLLCVPAAVAAMRGAELDVLVNADSLDQYSPADLETFLTNLEMLCSQESDVVLSFTLWRRGQSDAHLLGYCERFGIKRVRLDLARPSLLRNNQCVRTAQLQQFKPQLLSTARHLTSRGIRIGFDCPLPESFLTDQELDELRPVALRLIDPARPHLCSTVYINPDLTIACCPYQQLLDSTLRQFEDYDDLMETVMVAKSLRLQQGGDLQAHCYCEAERFLP